MEGCAFSENLPVLGRRDEAGTRALISWASCHPRSFRQAEGRVVCVTETVGLYVSKVHVDFKLWSAQLKRQRVQP